MRIAVRWLCVTTLTFAALACGRDPNVPCSAMDDAAGRCRSEGTAPLAIAPGTSRADWAAQLCEDWHRPDGSCDQAQVVADYQECLSKKGIPEQQHMIDQGTGSRTQLVARERATNLCMELRRWVMTETGRRGLLSGPPRPAPRPQAT